MASEAYLDYAGHVSRRWPSAYDEVIAKPCPRCHAKPLELCTNPVTPWKRNRAKVPCIARIRQDWGEAA